MAEYMTFGYFSLLWVIEHEFKQQGGRHIKELPHQCPHSSVFYPLIPSQNPAHESGCFYLLVSQYLLSTKCNMSESQSSTQR